MKSFKRFWESRNGKTWEGTEEELADEYKSTMGWFDYNLPYMLNMANDASGWTDEQVKDFNTMMIGYDKLDLGAGSTAKNFGRVGADPSTWIGLGTFGAGTVAAQGAKLAAKQGIKSIIKNRMSNMTVRGAAVGGAEGGAYTMVDDAARQETEDPNADYDIGRGLQAGALGVGLGGALGGGIARGFQARRFKTGNANKQDFYDATVRENKANARAEQIRSKNADLSNIGEGLGATGRWLNPEGKPAKILDKFENTAVIGPIIKGYKKAISSPIKQGTEGSMPTVNEGLQVLGQVAGIKQRGRMGDALPLIGGSGSTRMQAQNLKNDLFRRVLAGTIKTVGRKGSFQGTRHNLLSPLVQKRARGIARSGKDIPGQLDEAGIVGAANRAHTEQGYGSSLGQRGTFLNPGSTVENANRIPINTNLASKPVNIISRPPVKGQQVDAGVLGVSKELKAKIKAGKATKSEKVRYKLSTDGTVSIKDVNLNKTELSDVMSGKSIVSINKKTGEAVPCPK